MNYNEAYELLKAKNQLHILRYYDELDNEGKESLLKQISDIDFSILDNLHAKEEKKESTIVPIKAMMLEDIEKNTTNTSLQVLKPLRQGIWHWCFLPADKEPALVLMVLRVP